MSEQALDMLHARTSDPECWDSVTNQPQAQTRWVNG